MCDVTGTGREGRALTRLLIVSAQDGYDAGPTRESGDEAGSETPLTDR